MDPIIPSEVGAESSDIDAEHTYDPTKGTNKRHYAHLLSLQNIFHYRPRHVHLHKSGACLIAGFTPASLRNLLCDGHSCAIKFFLLTIFTGQAAYAQQAANMAPGFDASKPTNKQKGGLLGFFSGSNGGAKTGNGAGQEAQDAPTHNPMGDAATRGVPPPGTQQVAGEMRRSEMRCTLLLYLYLVYPIPCIVSPSYHSSWSRCQLSSYTSSSSSPFSSSSSLSSSS